ncbi:MAG: SufE family protein [Caldilineaceae bacterium SB0664_bin_27]|uniref:SufE family protein n=1 Tax=Caldilineaceae bacterium SB0664_bin_27 TaxID=2605260 RepID=A0A6B0YN71_9CHLR|nr:SufE family protein [Caldilineaceae bacterium SB0664_bin_27]
MAFDLTIEEKIDRTPPPLRAIIEDFRSMEPRERLESLLDFALSMPELPGFLHDARDQMEQVHECQTPIFVFTDIVDAGVHVYIDVPKESPTVRGYAAIVQEGLERASPDTVLHTPDDIHYLLGLHEAISPQRIRGLHVLMAYLKRQVTARMAQSE